LTGRAPADGGLRPLFRAHLPGWQLTAVETGATSPGTPDMEYCAPGGAQGWIENKMTRGWTVSFRPLQPGWISRRARLGGRVLVAVRRLSGPADELWLVDGGHVLTLQERGLRGTPVLGRWAGGPVGWDWGEVGRMLAGGTERNAL
jgi:hypothetical protein